MRSMMYSTKTALVIHAGLLPWQVANVAAFLSGGLAGTYHEIVGEPYRDGDGAPLFETTNDADNRANVAATPTAVLDLVGLGLHADRKTIDKITGGLKFLA